MEKVNLIRENEALLSVTALLEGLPAELSLHLQITHLRLREAIRLIQSLGGQDKILHLTRPIDEQ